MSPRSNKVPSPRAAWPLTPEPRVLELRVHGINNTAPPALLDLAADDVERVAGDRLGSFWAPTPSSLDRLRRAPDAAGRRGFVPRGIQREAYSWGGLVRSTPEATGPGGALVAGLARVGWALLLPFSIANAAAWCWRLPTDDRTAALSVRAGLVRLFGVLLTLLLLSTVTSVAVDLLAVQCYAGGSLACTVLPQPFEALARWTPGSRMALFSLVPVLVVVGLWLLSGVSRLRYDVADRYLEAREPSTPADSAGAQRAGGPLLARPQFWSNRGETDRLSLGHLAAGLSLVSVELSAQAVIDGGGGLVAAAGLSGGLLLIALITVFGTRTLPVEHVAAAGGWQTTLAGLSGAGYVATLGLLIAGWPPTGGDASGRSGFTAATVTLLAAVALMLAVIAASVFFRLPRAGAALRFEAWHGLAPAVFLSLALGIGLVLSSLVTVAAGDWLNGGAGASALLGSGPIGDPAVAVRTTCTETCVGLDPRLTIPTLYPWFGGVALIVFAAAVLIVAAALVRARSVARRVAAWVPQTPADEAFAADQPMPVGSAAELLALLGPVRDRKRATAARLHLVEPVVAILAVATVVAVVTTELLSWLYPQVSASPAPAGVSAAWTGTAGWVLAWLDVAMGAWAGIAVLVLAGLVLPAGTGLATRPLAIVWDLACFLPRAGHPLGAPCYTERAVPEVSRRILWWLCPESDASAARPRKVVLAAHSMGAVVSLAALFSLSSHSDWATLRPRMSLLTFGVQLRPYFGRFFPELLGPAVLGTTPCLRPRLWAADPWGADAAEEAVSLAGADVDAAASPVPARRWVSLWRATDPLGFPAYSNRPNGNPIDEFADEIDTSGYTGAIGGHGEYYRTRQYHSALADLAGTARPEPD